VGILTESDFVRWFAEGRSYEPGDALEEVGGRLARAEAWPALAE